MKRKTARKLKYGDRVVVKRNMTSKLHMPLAGDELFVGSVWEPASGGCRLLVLCRSDQFDVGRFFHMWNDELKLAKSGE